MTRKIKTIIMMAVISTILNFFGCSQPDKNEEFKPSKTMEKDFEKLINEYNNRPIYKELTKQNIDTSSDENLLELIFDNLLTKLPKKPDKEFEAVMSWNKPRQAIYMIWNLEAEVNNGGYNQFYFNSSGQFYDYLPNALKLIGANKFADLTMRANSTFQKENPKITRHQDGTLEGFSKSYDDNPLNKFDDEFYKLYEIENLHQIQVDYVRKHINDFIDK